MRKWKNYANTRDSHTFDGSIIGSCGAVEKVRQSCFGLFTLRVPVRQMQVLAPAIW